MRKETSEWLTPMVEEANRRGIDVDALFSQASFPATEAPTPVRDLASRLVMKSESEAQVITVDLLWFGQLLRHEIGWEGSYPALPPDEAEGR